MTLTGISFGISIVFAALGVLLMLLGLALFVKRLRIAGVIVALLGLGIAALPALAYLYVAAAMR